MSSAGVSGVAGGGAIDHQLYFCYQCNRTVSVTPSLTSELSCPNCNGEFLEEYEDSNPNPSPSPSPNSNPNPFFAFSDSFSGFPPFSSNFGGLPLVFSTSSSIDLQNPSDFSSLFSPVTRQRSASASLPEQDAFDPFVFLQNYLQTLRAGGANVQFVIENNPSDPGLGFRLPANLGDYFIGPGLEQLIQQLAENDPNRYGTPPASKSVVEALPNIKISDELLESDSAQCAVCKDTFEVGSEAKQMPCKHIYHSDCILPWLDMHNSCPVCRYELPTDDPDYENGGTPIRANSLPAAGSMDSGSVGASQENSPWPQMRRSLRISLPSIFRTLGFPGGTSNSGGGSNNGDNDGDLNSGDQGNRNFGSETRHEDLD